MGASSSRRNIKTLALLGLVAQLAVAATTAPSTQPSTAEDYDKLAAKIHQQNQIDYSQWPQERDAWNAALKLAPADKTALLGRLRLEEEITRYSPTPETLLDLRHAAADLIAHEANNPEATAYLHVSYLMPFLQGGSDDRASREHLKELTSLIAKNPELYDAGVYAAIGCLRDARMIKIRTGDTDVALRRIGDAVALFDKCVDVTPTDPIVLLHSYDILRAADEGWHVLSPASSNADSPYAGRIVSTLETARAHVRPGDRAVSDIYTGLATALQARGDAAGAERLARQGLDLRPEDQYLRLTLASLIHADPHKRDEAIALMRKPITDRPGPGAVGVRRLETMRTLTQLELLNDLAADFSSTPEKSPRRAKVSAQMDDALQGLEKISHPDDPLVLKAKARIELARGGTQEAIQAIANLEKARDVIRKEAKGQNDWDLELLLAYAYQASSQTGLAKSQFWRVIDARPDMVSARFAMARILISEHDTDMARRQLEAARKLAPNDPELPILESALSARSLADNPTKAAEALANMPETTPQQLHAKAVVAVEAKKPQDAVKLYERYLQQAPKDVIAIRELVQLYLSQDRRDDASRLVDASLKSLPADVTLQILKATLDHDTKKVDELTLKGLQAMPDPLARSLALYEFHRTHNAVGEAFKDLDAAEQIAPDDPRVWDIRFTNALLLHQYEEAAKYQAKLAATNYDEANGLIYSFRLKATRGDLAGAERDANEMLLRFPQYARSWQFLGDVLRYKGQYEQAIGKYASALERQSGSIDAIKGIVDCLQALGRGKESKRYIDSAARYFPRDPWIREQRGNWELAYGDIDAGIAAKKLERDERPSDFRANYNYAVSLLLAAQRVAPAGGSATTQPADLAKARGYSDQCRTELQKVVDRWPDEVQTYSRLAELAIYTGKLDDGEQALKRLAARDSMKGSNVPQTMLADYYVRCRKPELAIAAYEQAVNKGLLPERNQRPAAQFLADHDRYDLALAAVDRRSTDPLTQRFVAETLASAGRTQEALVYLQNLLAKRPNEATLYVAEASVLQKAKRYEEAVTACDAALQRNPNLGEAYYFRALARLARNPAKPELGLEDFVRASELTPPIYPTQFVQLHRATSDLMLRLGRADRAANELESALRVTPTDTDMRLKLVDIYTTRTEQPQWHDVQRLLDQAKSMPETASNPVWWELEAKSWLARKQPERALGPIRAAVTLAKRLDDPSHTVGVLKTFLNTLYLGGHYVELDTVSNELLANTGIKDTGWWVYQARAIAEAKQGDKNAAGDDFDKALAITTRLHDDRASAELAHNMLDSVGVDDALNHLEKMVAAGNVHLRSLEVRVCTVGGDYARAQAKADDLLADLQNQKLPEADAATIYDAVGVAYLYSEKYDRAKEMYEKVLAARPQSVEALNILATICAENLHPPDFISAQAYTDRAMELYDRNEPLAADILDTKGWVMVLSGNVDEGQLVLQSSAERARSPLTHFHLAKAAQLQGRNTECRNELKFAQKLMDQMADEHRFIDPRLRRKVESMLTELPQEAK